MFSEDSKLESDATKRYSATSLSGIRHQLLAQGTRQKTCLWIGTEYGTSQARRQHHRCKRRLGGGSRGDFIYSMKPKHPSGESSQHRGRSYVKLRRDWEQGKCFRREHHERAAEGQRCMKNTCKLHGELRVHSHPFRISTVGAGLVLWQRQPLFRWGRACSDHMSGILPHISAGAAGTARHRALISPSRAFRGITDALALPVPSQRGTLLHGHSRGLVLAFLQPIPTAGLTKTRLCAPLP